MTNDTHTAAFRCAVSTCMVSEGMCKGKTVSVSLYPLVSVFKLKTKTNFVLKPPRCGPNNRKRRTVVGRGLAVEEGKTNSSFLSDKHTMDLNAGKIVVFDLDDSSAGWMNDKTSRHQSNGLHSHASVEITKASPELALPSARLPETDFNWPHNHHSSIRDGICFSHQVIIVVACSVTFTVMAVLTASLVYYTCNRHLRSKF